MKNFEKKISALDVKRSKAEAKLAKVSKKLENRSALIMERIQKLSAKAEAKQQKVLAKFAAKNGVAYELVAERYGAIQEAKKAALLDKKISKQLVK